MRRSLRFLTGITLGSGTLAAVLWWVGIETVVMRATAITPWALAVVVALVVLEGVVDAVGVWASVRPLGEGLSGLKSIQFALAGDFFDILSPAGPVSSEPIMARFISVATNTGYSDALGVRGLAKYVKSGAQLLWSGALGLVVLLGVPAAQSLLVTLGIALAGVAVVGVGLVVARRPLSTVLVTVLTPVVSRVSALYRTDPYDRTAVTAAVDRVWERAFAFRDRPVLVGLIALGGILEQLLTAAALWVALVGTGTAVAYLAIVIVVPLPQVASVVPVPGSVGAYDLLVVGALTLVTGAAAAPVAAAVLVVRTVSLPFGAATGGVCVAFLRGWRPTN